MRGKAEKDKGEEMWEGDEKEGKEGKGGGKKREKIER